MTPFATFARPALLAAALSVLAALPATADQRMFNDFLRGDTRTAVAYIESGGDPMVRDKNGMTLLHWAAWTGEEEIARSLISRGVDVDVRSEPGGATPLMQASGGAGLPMVDYFLAEGADVNAANDLNFTALHFVASRSPAPDAPEVLARLLDAGADPLKKVNDLEAPDHGFLPLDGARKHYPALLKTDAGRRLVALTYEGTGCEGVIVQKGDVKLSIIAERTLGRGSRWKEIVELNDLEGKGYRKGDCLALPKQ